MLALRRDIPAMATTVNVLLVLWMLFGRAIVMPLGWFTLFGLMASPIIALCLWSSTRTMRSRPDPVLTSAQARAQLVLWAAMFVFGFTVLDANDNPDDRSVLTTLWSGGHAVSGWLSMGSIVVGVVAWIVLQQRLTADVAAAQARSQTVDPAD
jgi:hypothetical protein